MVERTSKIGLITAIIIGMNAMIGSGIFSAPLALSALVGRAGVLAYLFVTVAVWCIAQSLARLSQLFPKEGSFYLYAKAWGGHPVGILASASYLIGLTIAMGLLCQMAGLYLHSSFPFVSAHALGLLILGLLVTLNMFGMVLSQWGQYVLIACTVFPLIAITAICLLHIDVQQIGTFHVESWTNVLHATRIVIFGFFGFECATSLFAVVRDPSKNVPRALTYSIVIVGIIYTLFAAAIMYALPIGLQFDMSMPLPEVLSRVLTKGRWILPLIHLSIIPAIIGTIHSMIWSASILLSGLVRLISKPSRQSADLLSQNNALIVIGLGIVISYITVNRPDLFFNLTAIFVVSAFLLSMITLLTRKAEWQSGFNIITIVGMLTAGMIMAFAVQGFVSAL